MRVVVPYTYVGREVATALGATHRPWDMLPVGGSDRDYYDLLTRLWAEGETFVIVEHDIVVHPTAIDELEQCTHEWCGFPHYYGRYGLTYGLGCVKFDAALMARHPDAMIRVGVMSDPTHPKRHWCRLDAWLQGTVLPHRGEVKHCHDTPVRHLGTGCSHGCTAV